MFLDTPHCFLLILSSQCLQELSAQTYVGTLFDPNQERSELLDFDDGGYGNWSHTGVKIVGIGDTAEIPDKEDGSGDGDSVLVPESPNLDGSGEHEADMQTMFDDVLMYVHVLCMVYTVKYSE